MHQLESNRAPDFPVNNLASTYIGPRPIWSEAPNAGAQANATAKLGTFAPAHPGAQSAKPTSGLTAPQTGRGNGQGNAAGSGNANANTGRAGVKTGAPDISGLPKPEYPEESLRRREEGTVMVSVTVLSDGSVGEITVVSTPPFSRLTRKALDAARQVRFDRAYAGWVVKIPYEFKLPD
jgi:TonB family protein